MRTLTLEPSIDAKQTRYRDANRNRYVGNGPMNATDPSGLEEKAPLTAGAIVRGRPPKSLGTSIVGPHAIIDYLGRIYVRRIDSAESSFVGNIGGGGGEIRLGTQNSEPKQLGHLCHELVAGALHQRFTGAAETQFGGRSAVFPDGRQVPGWGVTGSHNLGLIVELAAIAEARGEELTDEYLQKRWATANLRPSPNEQYIPYEEDIAAIVTWLREVLQGEHQGGFIRRDYTLDVTHFGCDKERLRISAIFREEDGKIDGELQLILED